MAVRTSVKEVRELIVTTQKDNVIRNNYIKTANLLVEENLLTVGHSDALLTEIEKYLGAHFTAVFEEKAGLSKETLGDAADTYDNNYEAGLMSTRFGQQAIWLDTSGTLTRLGSTKFKAEFRLV